MTRTPRRGIEPGNIVIEKNTGRLASRLKLGQMLARLERGGAVVATRLRRIGRNHRHLPDLAEQFEANGIPRHRAPQHQGGSARKSKRIRNGLDRPEASGEKLVALAESLRLNTDGGRCCAACTQAAPRDRKRRIPRCALAAPARRHARPWTYVYTSRHRIP
jgi:DNA invertase Pin-like site-specific DNA recombinase